MLALPTLCIRDKLERIKFSYVVKIIFEGPIHTLWIFHGYDNGPFFPCALKIRIACNIGQFH